MNILFFCGSLGKTLNANNKIASTIAEEFAKKGHNVTLVGLTTDDIFSTQIEPSASGLYTCVYLVPNEFYYSERHKLFTAIKGKNGISKLFYAFLYALKHPLSAAIALYSYSYFFKPETETDKVQSFTKKYVADNNIDVAIVSVFPTIALSMVFDCKLDNCKKIIYQLDPIGFHETSKASDKQKFIDIETHYFDIADHIFTTAILKKQYNEHSAYIPFTDKISSVEFPTLCYPAVTTDCPVNFDKTKTNIVFCGTIDDRYRSPQKFLSCIEHILKTDLDIAVHFVGINSSDTAKEYAQLYPENIFIQPRIETQYVPALLENADILLNIGNNLRMQLPSKIFEYFATGKPIIHQQIIDDCTCKAYMDKYPLAFSLNDVSDATADKLHAFIKNAVGQSLSFSQIEQLFSDSTPQYVSEKMLDILTTL